MIAVGEVIESVVAAHQCSLMDVCEVLESVVAAHPSACSCLRSAKLLRVWSQHSTVLSNLNEHVLTTSAQALSRLVFRFGPCSCFHNVAAGCLVEATTEQQGRS